MARHASGCPLLGGFEPRLLALSEVRNQPRSVQPLKSGLVIESGIRTLVFEYRLARNDESSESWSGARDTFRTLFLAPPPDVRSVFAQLEGNP
jgi:hypothetical protein